jgi:hypothetical protein
VKPQDAYFAGFFDADGTVGIAKASRGAFGMNVSVCNVDANVVMAYKHRFGGSVGTRDNNDANRPVHYWNVSSAKADAFLEAIAPYLIVKRERVLLAIEFRNLYKGENCLSRNRSGRSEKQTRRILQRRNSCYEKMIILNLKGRPM